VRLAFSIAAHAEPDVLLVDEVLGVGDERFQQKCFDWVAQATGGDATLLGKDSKAGAVAGVQARAVARMCSASSGKIS